ncbi:uncharacterized protein LOC119107767 [Pollicipes pollicipes]|uniref:uncharacterized protein LOC119092312 n=1 Tax=Pollicipes pollicipes TaxID=41117 RepID=UPI001884CB15|nr:uncharacterized protein LOC119092312 [Pollicipes pollicipes]XP_037087210.1 uncharacterized protein LOC119107767 [Pollicipes pollicipes]
MSSGQYDLPPEERRLIEERRNHRMKLKGQWQKLVSNPHGRQGGGYVFDPAIQRFMSMRVTQYDTFRPTLGNFFRGVGITAIPILLFCHLMWWDRERLEKKYSTGQVAYKDRLWKTYR